jgi:precorrin-6B methylase 2
MPHAIRKAMGAPTGSIQLYWLTRATMSLLVIAVDALKGAAMARCERTRTTEDGSRMVYIYPKPAPRHSTLPRAERSQWA